MAEVMAEKTSASVVATPVATSMAARSQAESHSPVEQPQPAEMVVRPTAEAPLVPAAEQVTKPITRSLPNGPRPISASGGDALVPPIAPSTTESAEAKAEAPPALGSLTPVITPAFSPVPAVSPAPSRSERAATSRPPRNDASSSREIHITIGRIEVRAVHPPPEPLPQQRPAPASPKISLEEYLKQRNGARS